MDISTQTPTTIEAEERRNRLLGIGLVCAASACFVFLDTIAKYLGQHMDVLQVVWARYFSAFVLALLIFNPVSHPNLLKTKRPALQLVRSTLLLCSTVFNFLALRYLRLDQTITIGFATPLFVAVLAGPLLSEWIGWRRWLAILVGFSGVVLVTRPGLGGIHPAAILSVGATLSYALYLIQTRVIARYDRNETTLFYSNLVGALALLPLLPFVWTTPQSLGLGALMIGFGAFASLGHYFLIHAYRLAPASVIAPFSYSQLLLVVFVGFAVFGDLPDGWTLAGAAVVTASGLYLLARERKLGIKRD